ncbi:MAG: Ig-like domain-containing protein, partial [Planctomycetota bacterium]
MAVLVLGLVSSARAIPFVRGDANSDGGADISDSVSILSFLVLGGDEPNCLDAADTNDDGTIDISDGISLLGFLFLGADAPPFPYPDCGEDPSEDSLTCFFHPPCPIVDSSPVAIESTSPRDRESGVAISRELTMKFSRELDLATVVPSAFTAIAAGEVLDSRLHVSPDRTRVTLFWSNPLPGNTDIEVTIDGDQLSDPDGNAVDGNGDGESGGAYILRFQTLSLAPVEGAAVYGRVLASELGEDGVNEPLAGVTITVDGMEETLRTETDKMGNFRLDPAPAGRFFVHINGRTTTNEVPEGAYYPSVGKTWRSVPGEAGGTEVGTVHLPLIPPETLVEVSEVEDTVVEFPQSVLDEFPDLGGVQISVPADSLFADDGTRGGRVGIAPVAPDRLPGELPPGLNFGVVITVQTDGATNFDRPVPVRFPNLPDPETGEALPPGEKSALWSFNHDTGRFEVVGPMTVTEDGLFVESDPGVGILAPGWHGQDEGTPGDGDGCEPDEEEDDDDDDCSLAEAVAAGTGFIRNAVSLAAEFFPVLKGIKCGIAVIDSAAGLARDIEDLLARDSVGCQALGTLKTTLNGIAGVMDCVPGIAVVSRLNDLCSTTTDIVGAVGNLLECLPGPLANQVSRWVNTLNDYLGVAVAAKQRLLGLADPKRQIVSLIASLTSKIDAIACENFAFAPGEDLLDDQMRAELRELVGLVREQCAAFEQFSLAEVEYGLTLSRQIRAETPIAARAIEGGLQLLPVRGRIYAAVTIEDRVERLVFEGSFRWIFPPDTIAQVELWNPRSGDIAEADLRTDPSGFTTYLGEFIFLPEEKPVDTDGDTLSDRAERIIGSNAELADTNGDGVTDAAAIAQGLDPAMGSGLRTGIVATADTPGTAVDVCAVDELVIVADFNRGISVFNVFEGLEPSLIARVDTPGTALAVACTGDRVAVADGERGLAIVDIADPPRARIADYVSWRDLGGGVVRAVAAAGTIVFAGTSSGNVSSVDLESGGVLSRIRLPAQIEDLAISGDTVYALVLGRLWALSLVGGELSIAGSVQAPGIIGAGRRRLRLFAGEGQAWGTHTQGYNTFAIGDGQVPELLTHCVTQQFGWKQIVPDGSGGAVAAVSPNSTDDGPHHISTYGLAADDTCNDFRARIETPGLAAAVAFSNGLAYVADSRSGLQVIRPVSIDAFGVAPTIELSANFDLNDSVDEGKPALIRAQVVDDVLVRSVEFFVNGERYVDGSFPFELRLVTPLARDVDTLAIRARAIDTGGNSNETEEFSVRVQGETIPP